ncbi:MAG: hypothetical protein CFE38_13240 [Comamonadaceae bacterium PBBC1]|nr:MAG: hypothetical protein CFE38_13240 [Comamonadaceae bacterium PBBC1]
MFFWMCVTLLFCCHGFMNNFVVDLRSVDNWGLVLFLSTDFVIDFDFFGPHRQFLSEKKFFDLL